MDELTMRQLDAYLDGTMTPELAAAFEARLQHDAGLQEAVEQQRQIDSALRRLIAAPVTPPAIPSLHTERAGVLGTIRPSIKSVTAEDQAGALRPSQNWLRRLAVAAMLALGAFGVWSVWNHFRPIDDIVAKVNPDQYYRDQVANHMQVYYVCDPATPKFAAYFHDELGQPLLMKADDPGFKCLGINKCNVISPNTRAVLTQMQDTPIIVLIDRRTSDSHPVIPPNSDLHLYHRDLGSLTLYEITPLDHARVLDLFRNPSAG